MPSWPPAAIPTTSSGSSGGARAARDRASAESERLAAAVAERLRTLPDVAALRERLDAADERVARLQHVDRVLRLAETELAEAAAETYRDFAPAPERLARGRHRRG